MMVNKYVVIFGVDDSGNELFKGSMDVEFYDSAEELKNRVLSLLDWRGYPFYAVDYMGSTLLGSNGYIHKCVKYTPTQDQNNHTKLVTTEIEEYSKRKGFALTISKLYFDLLQKKYGKKQSEKGRGLDIEKNWLGEKGETRIAQLVFMASEDFSQIRDEKCSEAPGYIDVNFRVRRYGIKLTFSSTTERKEHTRSCYLSLDQVESTELPPIQFYAAEIWPSVKRLMSEVLLERDVLNVKKSFTNYKAPYELKTGADQYILGAWDEEQTRFWYLGNNWLTKQTELVWTANRDSARVLNTEQKQSLSPVVDYINSARGTNEPVLSGDMVGELHFIQVDCGCWRCVRSKKREQAAP